MPALALLAVTVARSATFSTELIGPEYATMLPDPGCRVTIAGQTQPPDRQIVVSRLGSDGVQSAGVVFGSAGNELQPRLARHALGGMVVAFDRVIATPTREVTLAVLDRCLSPLWQVGAQGTMSVTDVSTAPDGSIYVAINDRTTSVAERRPALLKFEADGRFAWGRAVASRAGCAAAAVAATADGGCALQVAIPLPSWNDGMIVKLSARGDLEWSRLSSVANYDEAHGILARRSGTIVGAFMMNESDLSWSGLRLVEFDLGGRLLRSRKYSVTAGAFQMGFLVQGNDGPLVLSHVTNPGVGELGVMTTILADDWSVAATHWRSLGGRAGSWLPPEAHLDEDSMHWSLVRLASPEAVRLVRAPPSGEIDACVPVAYVPRAADDTTYIFSRAETVEAITPAFADVPLNPSAATLAATDSCRATAGTAPAEVSPPSACVPLLFADKDTLTWEPGAPSTSESFDLYRGDIAALRAGDFGQCLSSALPAPTFDDPALPGVGTPWCYLVAGRNQFGTGTLGRGSRGTSRTPSVACP